MAVSKYKNTKVTVAGKQFDSQHEAKRYIELTWMLKAGLIKELELQKKFVLIPTQRIDGKLAEKECSYKADFYYYDNQKKAYVCEDAKGYKGGEAYKLFVIKRKLMLEKYGIRVIEV